MNSRMPLLSTNDSSDRVQHDIARGLEQRRQRRGSPRRRTTDRARRSGERCGAPSTAPRGIRRRPPEKTVRNGPGQNNQTRDRSSLSSGCVGFPCRGNDMGPPTRRRDTWQRSSNPSMWPSRCARPTINGPSSRNSRSSWADVEARARRSSDTRAPLGGRGQPASSREWDAEITEQHPDHRVAWTAHQWPGWPGRRRHASIPLERLPTAGHGPAGLAAPDGLTGALGRQRSSALDDRQGQEGSRACSRT